MSSRKKSKIHHVDQRARAADKGRCRAEKHGVGRCELRKHHVGPHWCGSVSWAATPEAGK